MHYKHLVTIVGSGFGGLGAAYQLTNAGICDFVILERNKEVGGVWWENTYPGIECDIPSHLYCFSFFDNPEWSRIWAPGREILDYLVRLSNWGGIRSKIHFDTATLSAAYDEANGIWLTTDERGNTYQSKYLIMAAGKQASPKIPEIPGLESFNGHYLHSARWDHTVDFSQKRIAVIGTGTSAAQFIPILAKVAKKLTVFQRSGLWVMPKPNAQIEEADKAKLRANPSLIKELRKKIHDITAQFWPCTLTVANATDYIPDGFINDKNEIQIWPCALTGRNEDAKSVALQYLQSVIKDEELRRKLTPDYPIGAKRVGYSNDYLPTFNLSHVELETQLVNKIYGDTLFTTDGKGWQIDIIVFATGFHSTRFLSTISSIRGLSDRDLRDVWRNESNAEAYYGTFVHNFPNMFLLSGPNSSLGSTGSVLELMESQINIIVQAISHVEGNNLKSIMVKKSVQIEHNLEIQEFCKKTVLVAKTNSWYKTADNKVTNVWPFLVSDFIKRTEKLNMADYIFEVQRASRHKKSA